MKKVKDSPKPRILIVEDEETVSETLKVILELRGYHVMSSDNGRAGLNMVYQFRPDLIVLDLILPEMDGLTILETIREQRHLQDIPVIIMTVVTQESELADGFWQKAIQTEGFVTKPFDPLQLADKIEALLGDRHAPRTS